MGNVGVLARYYEALSRQMLEEIGGISSAMDSNPAEKGVNNEKVLQEFLARHLPTRYSVSTGKVVSADGEESGQVDLIIHDRLLNPAFHLARAWSIVPVETVAAVVSVKTTLDKTQLKNALEQVATVRKLPRTAAQLVAPEGVLQCQDIPRPRGFVFAFKSSWSTSASADAAFLELSRSMSDDLRCNAVCLLDQACIIRKPYTLETTVYDQHPLLHFFVFLTRVADTFPKLQVDLRRYFERYDEPSLGEEATDDAASD